ncbi:hypothetical protein ACQCVP_23955, partial [Rossellomorea vietnamensis]
MYLEPQCEDISTQKTRHSCIQRESFLGDLPLFKYKKRAPIGYSFNLPGDVLLSQGESPTTIGAEGSDGDERRISSSASLAHIL